MSPPVGGSLQQGRDLGHDLLFVRELARLELGVDQLAVGGQLETASPRGDEFQLPDLLLEGGEQLGGQTDRLRLVASHGAVLQLEVHAFSPSGGARLLPCC